MTIYVIDDKRFLPAGKQFQSRVLDHQQAVTELKRDPYWQPCFEYETGGRYRLAHDVLWRESGRKMDPGYRFEDHKFDEDPVRLGMGDHQFLLIHDDLTYEFFTPETLNTKCPHCDKPISLKLPYKPEKFVCPQCDNESSIGHTSIGLALIAPAPTAVKSKPATKKRPSKKKSRTRRG